MKLALLATGAALALTIPVAASAATTVGQAPPTAGSSFNCGPGVGVQISTSSGVPYAVPSPGGVITRWRSSAGGTVALTVWTGSGTTWRAVAEDEKTVGGTLTEFGTRIPVSGGEYIGLRIPNPTPGCAFQTPNAADQFGAAGSAPIGTPTTITISEGFRLNVAVDVEPDADKDDFGDETQDQCPTDASTQGACDTDPPETTITKGAPNKLDQAKVTFKFVSDEPDSIFECKVDRKPFKPCTSPRTVKRLDEGQHKFKVFAIDAAGNAGPAAKDKFKVVG